MKRSLTIISLGAVMATAAMGSAKAEERWPMWYVGLSGGYTYMQDQDISGSSSRSMSLDNGYGIGGSIGYLPNSSIPLLNSMRFEAEITYHQNNLNQIKTNSGSISGHGDYDTTAYMVNAFYDLPLNSRWSPYIGGGIGAANVKLTSGGGAGNTNDSDSEFAYQGMVGIGYSPDTIPNTQWTLGYRYLATSDPKFAAAAGSINTEYSSHNIELGAKFRF